MEAITYEAPRTLDEAYAVMGNGKRTAVLAGGTDIIVQLREGRKSADQVLDVKHIAEMVAHSISADGSLEIGAATPCVDLYEDAEVVKRLPGLIDAASLIGGIQIQGRASLGGNICNAGPAADSAPILIALGAILKIGSKAGTREIPVVDLFTGPSRNSLQAGELLLQIRIPAQPANSNAFYLRFIPRNEMDIAVCSSGVSLGLGADGNINHARISIGASAPTPLFVEAAGASLIGKAPTKENFTAAGELCSAAVSPIDDMRGSVAQRRHLAKVLTVRALEGALKRVQETR